MVLAIHELLSDLASHITTQRTDNMFRNISNQLDALSIDNNYLLDPKEMVDHIKLQQSVQQATMCRRNNNKPRPKRNDNHDTISTTSNQSVISRNTADHLALQSSQIPQSKTVFQQRQLPKKQN
jgi:hypothetical protein